MKNQIAVFTNDHDQPADFYMADRIAIYRKESVWKIERTIQLTHIKAKSVVQIRKIAAERQEQISDCKVVVAKELSGIPYTVFDMAGYSIFTMECISDELLDSILFDLTQAEYEAKSTAYEKPIEIADSGYFQFDLIAVQALHPEISSKMALKDFLEDTPFMELRLKCSHIPPWIEKAKAIEVLSVSDNAYIIRKKQCRE